MVKYWRPLSINKDILRKLEEGFSYGYSDQEACLYADIWTSTLYDYCKRNPDFSERKELLKRTISIHAKRNIFRSIKKGDIKASLWWLERKNKSEFNMSSEQIISINNEPDKEGIKAVQELLKIRDTERKEREQWYNDRNAAQETS